MCGEVDSKVCKSEMRFNVLWNERTKQNEHSSPWGQQKDDQGSNLKVDVEKLEVQYLRGVSVGWVKVVMVETERSYCYSLYMCWVRHKPENRALLQLPAPLNSSSLGTK